MSDKTMKGLGYLITAAAVIVTAAVGVIGWQLSSISGLTEDIRNTNNRIDEVFPQLTQQAKDVGNLLGEARVTNSTLENLDARLVKVITVNESQSKGIAELVASIDRLASVVEANTKEVGGRLDSIESEIKALKEARLDDGFQFDSVIPVADLLVQHDIVTFDLVEGADEMKVLTWMKGMRDAGFTTYASTAPESGAKYAMGFATSDRANMPTASIEDVLSGWFSFQAAKLAEVGVDPSKVFLATDDPDTAKLLDEIQGAGAQRGPDGPAPQ